MRKSQDKHIGYLLLQLSHKVNQLHNEKLESEGVTASQERLLTLLYKKEGVTQSELHHELHIKPSSLTKLVDVLVHKGLVKRETSELDGRTKHIYLTEAGKQKEERLWQIKEEIEAHITQLLNEHQLTSLIELLHLVRKRIL
ncbi:hypothetical protein A6P54_19955 [Bacillus sp. MKU004]|jgi:DNA-binding MarR family transcriptional regulator|nr:hypothetical protein A6P54_19955 [Bacillus sp. MKU004]